MDIVLDVLLTLLMKDGMLGQDLSLSNIETWNIENIKPPVML